MSIADFSALFKYNYKFLVSAKLSNIFLISVSVSDAQVE